MRAYTLSMLSQLAESGSPIVEAEIINWANTKLGEAGKKSGIRSFQDSSVSNAAVIVDLVDAIKPGTINYDLMRMDGGDEVGNSCCAIKLKGVLKYSSKFTGTNKWNISVLRYIVICCIIVMHPRLPGRHIGIDS